MAVIWKMLMVAEQRFRRVKSPDLRRGGRLWACGVNSGFVVLIWKGFLD